MTETRFKPVRAGIINLWDYYDEEFAFADGWKPSRCAATMARVRPRPSRSSSRSFWTAAWTHAASTLSVARTAP